MSYTVIVIKSNCIPFFLPSHKTFKCTILVPLSQVEGKVVIVIVIVRQAMRADHVWTITSPFTDVQFAFMDGDKDSLRVSSTTVMVLNAKGKKWVLEFKRLIRGYMRDPPT